MLWTIDWHRCLIQRQKAYITKLKKELGTRPKFLYEIPLEFDEIDIIKYVVENKKPDKDEILIDAVRLGRLEIVKYLVEKGAKYTLDILIPLSHIIENKDENIRHFYTNRYSDIHDCYNYIRCFEKFLELSDFYLEKYETPIDLFKDDFLDHFIQHVETFLFIVKHGFYTKILQITKNLIIFSEYKNENLIK